MPTTSNVLVLDVGTSSMRGAVYNRHGEAVKTVRTSYQPSYHEGGIVEQDPTVWLDSLIGITRSVVEWAKSGSIAIDAISLTAQRSSAIAVDEQGRPLYPAIMWQDKRTSRLCDELQPFGDAVFQRTGLRISPVLTAPKFAWIRQQLPELYRQSFKLLTIADYLLFAMIGRFVTDHTYASRTLLMNLRTLQWDQEMLELFGVDLNKLCELGPQGSVVGCITKSFQARTGLAIGTPVISAGGDQQCGALGAGVMQRGAVQVTTGTGSYVLAASDHVYLDPGKKVLCSVSAVPGQYVLESSMLTTSSLYAWAGRTLYDNPTDEAALLQRVSRDAEAATVGSKGVLLLPHFQGRGSPDWNADASGILANLTLATTRGEIARSVLEGIAAEVAENVDLSLHHMKGEPHITIAGGLSNLPLFNQILADMVDRDLSAPENKETTALGAWISAAVAIGLYDSHAEAYQAAQSAFSSTVYRPIPQNVEVYRRLRTRRAHLYNTLRQGGIYKLFRENGPPASRQT